MLNHFRFFIWMLVGMTLWGVFFASSSQSYLEIISISVVATLFKWLFERFEQKE
ncbi:hypothetical protein [Halobacillus litoralis]|uniref:hypothetical protein n=1 Tax=Halobacillus litoralis TaxID=45668 RepID=UPI0013E8ED8F|nr:hypothetical protein [Halobacillus litoralis]